jgi:hypothetical protein
MLKHLFFASCLIAAATAYLANEGQAKACSPAQAPEGYIVSVKANAFVTGDPASALVCSQMGPCGTVSQYKSVKKSISVVPVVNAAAGTAGELKLNRGDEVIYIMKDAADMEVERHSGVGLSEVFSKLGTKVCIRVSAAGVDSGIVDAPEEVCAPITVISLDVTGEDQASHDAQVAEACSPGSDAGVAGDSGVTTDPGANGVPGGSNSGGKAGPGGGGCTVASPPSRAGGLSLFGLAALAGCAIRSRKRSDG